MSDAGIGRAPLGSSSFGYGAPTRASSTSAKLYLDERGVLRNAAAVDAVTGDLVRDPLTGIHRGMNSTQQQVYLAVRTIKGSSIVQRLGILTKVKVITDTTAQKVRSEVNTALADLVSRGLITVGTIDVQRVRATGIRVHVYWTDLTNGETNVEKWDNG
jgi:hypothetical protein